MSWRVVLPTAIAIGSLHEATANFNINTVPTCFDDSDCQLYGDSEATCALEGDTSWCLCSEEYDHLNNDGTALRICFPKEPTDDSLSSIKLSLVSSLKFTGIQCGDISLLTGSFYGFSKEILSFADVTSVTHSCQGSDVVTTTVISIALDNVFNSNLVTYPSIATQRIASGEINGYPLGAVITFERLSIKRAGELWCPPTEKAQFRAFYGTSSTGASVCADVVCSSGFGFDSQGECKSGITDPSGIRTCNTDYDCTLHGDPLATCSRTDAKAHCVCTGDHVGYTSLSTSLTSTSTFYSCFEATTVTTSASSTKQEYILSISLIDVICDVDGDVTNTFNTQLSAVVKNIFDDDLEIQHFCEAVVGERSSTHNVHIAVIATGTVMTAFTSSFAQLSDLIKRGPATVFTPRSFQFAVTTSQASGYGCQYKSGVLLTVGFEGTTTCKAMSCLDGYTYSSGVGTCSATPAPIIIEDDEISVGTIAGIVLGCVAAVVIIAVMIYFFCLREPPEDPYLPSTYKTPTTAMTAPDLK